MRIADRTSARNYLTHLYSAKSDFEETTAQIASGNRFTKISDDITAGTRVMNIRMDMYKTETHLDNVESINDELTLTENRLLDVSSILEKAHTLAIKAKNEDKDADTRNIIANEVENLRKQLLTNLNAKYGDKYVFGGSNASQTEPFTENADGELEYNGILVDDILHDATTGEYYHMVDDPANPTGPKIRAEIPMDEDVYMDIGLGIKMNESDIQGDTGFKVSYSGIEVFGFGTDAGGNSYNIYNILLDLENAMKDDNTEVIGHSMDRIETATDKFLVNLTEIGSQTLYLDTVEGRLKDTVDIYKVSIDDLMGTNYEEASTTLTMNEAILKAVQQMSARIMPASLMDFLS